MVKLRARRTINTKIVIGIILPLFIVITLAVISNSEIGLTIDKSTITAVNSTTLFLNQTDVRPQITVQTININNDFGIARRVSFPYIIACLHSINETREPQRLDAIYDAGEYISNSFFFVDIFDLLGSDGYSKQQRSIEVGANDKRKVKLLVAPLEFYNYENVMPTYRHYDEILLFEVDGGRNTRNRYSYQQCGVLTSEKLDDASRIKIVYPEPRFPTIKVLPIKTK